MRLQVLVGAFCASLLANSLGVEAGVIDYYTNEAAWADAVIGIEAFNTTSAAVALAEEVASAPVNNAQVGPILTFHSANTGLSWSFSVRTLQAGAGFTFGDVEAGSSPAAGFANALSVGDIDNYENDDWRVDVLSGPSLYAFGVWISDNNLRSGEAFAVYDTNSALIGSTGNVPIAGSSGQVQFFGVISDIAIGAVRWDSPGTDGDDIAISNFRFATVPEPAASSLLALGALTLIRRRG